MIGEVVPSLTGALYSQKLGYSFSLALENGLW